MGKSKIYAKYARTGHVGAASELRASIWLIDQGYEVFRNLAPVGKIDIIARHPATADLLFIDVKTSVGILRTRSDGAVLREYSNAEKPCGEHIKLLFVYEDGTVSWEKREIELVSPPKRPSKKWVVHFPFRPKRAIRDRH